MNHSGAMFGEISTAIRIKFISINSKSHQMSNKITGTSRVRRKQKRNRNTFQQRSQRFRPEFVSDVRKIFGLDPSKDNRDSQQEYEREFDPEMTQRVENNM